MKKYYLLLVILISNILTAQIFQDTKGELSVSGSGTASYKVPIALPPGIRDVAPQLALVYNGSSVQGMAGMGWNMVGISSITRTSSRIDLDGVVDAVDFDNLDRFALDGQRLIAKDGVYGATGTTYQTENYSNLKIESAGNFSNKALETCRTINFGGFPQTTCITPTSVTTSAPENFTITFPDGSQAFYGGTTDSRGLMEWMINRWIDQQGNYIDYTYETENNTIRIKNISWGKNVNAASTYENLIEFTYKDRLRAEFAYLNGIKVASTKILSFVTVRTGGTIFRKYTLEHEPLSSNYQRVKSITEINETNEKANPVLFEYDDTNKTIESFGVDYYKSPTNAQLNDVKLTGDFNGDGQQDFVTKDKLYLNPIGNNNNWTGLDFSVVEKKCFTATTLASAYNPYQPTVPSYTLNQVQSIVKVQESSNSITFNVYNLNPEIPPYLNGMGLNSSRIINLANTGINPESTRRGSYTKDSNLYLEGDYNGDGISELVIKSSINETKITRCPPRGGICTSEVPKNDGYEYYFLFLDPNSPNQEPIKLAIQSDSESKDYVADFNGDGKADILIINEAFKTYKIISFKQLKVAPWMEIEVLNNNIFAPSTFAEYDKDKQLVFGDFNGDSKTDIMIPEKEDSSNWFLYQGTGTGFERIAYPNFEWYEPSWDGPPSPNRVKRRTYSAADLNKDGKSDFIMSEYEAWTPRPNDRDARGHFYYKQNIGTLATQPVFAANEYLQVTSDYGYNTPITLLIGDYKNHQANFNFAFIQGAQIWKGKFNRDLARDATLVKVTESAGAITQTVSYKPLMTGSGIPTANDVYYSSHGGYLPTFIEKYPFTELIKVPTMNVVDKITVTGAGQTKSQLFKYFGLVTHAQGFGVLGFKKTARSSWYNDANPAKIWACSQMNPQLIGQKILEWSYSGDDHLANFVGFNAINAKTPILSLTTNTYTSSFLANGVKIIVPSKSEKKDFLTGLTDKTDFFYDAFWNIKSTLATNALGTKEVINKVYDNPSGVGKLYALGRIKQTNQILTAYGDTFTTEEKFDYHPTHTNLVLQSQKKGHNTDYITTTYVYDIFGNVTEKTIAAPGVSSRTIKDAYDPEGRFVVQKTDHELFVSKFLYNKLGQVTSATAHTGAKNTTTYDKWGKIINSTVTGTSTTSITSTMVYTRFADGGFSVTTTNAVTNEVSRTFQDVFGRTTKSTTKGFALGTWISKSTEYDFLGRKTKESEPYFDSSPTIALGSGTKWNSVVYDYLSRPTSQTGFNGRIQTISYNVLSTTTIDGPKTIKVTVDANGNKTELKDNTETLTYTYYANDTPKETIYGSHKITTKFDGWGRQIYMLDPSVSVKPYVYSYNNFGEMLLEQTPTGYTQYSFSPAGRVTKKASIGQNTNVVNNYIYNTTGFLTSTTGTSNGKTFSYTNEYNSYEQLTSKTEVTADNLTHKITFTYDTQGKTLNATSSSYLTKNSAVNNGNKTIQYGYNPYNGILEKITDLGTTTVLWKLNTANEKMQALSASLGNGMQITNTYDDNDYVKTINHTAGANIALNLEYGFKGDRGTLDYRKNTIPSVLVWKETFVYDSFERLESWTDLTGTAANSYETDGRIKTNNLIGTYKYGTANRYQKLSASLNANGTNLYQSRSPQTVTYNMFKNPTTVVETTRGRVDFEFNLGTGRSKSTVTTEAGTTIKNKYYSGISNVEVIEKPGQSFQFITFIAGSPYDAVVALEKTYTISGTTYTASTEEYLYLHRDYQGTILAISGNAGVIKERRQFDPWGVLKKYYKNGVEINSTTFSNVDFEFLTDRGYTGHEHFFSVGIIHMNGRIYDPVLRTFLSADPFIQDGNNSQNFNRYAYCWNNPLKYTDSSGNFVELGIGTVMLIGALISGTVYTAVTLYYGNFTWGGLAKSIVVGAASGAASFGIGDIVQGIQIGSNAFNIGSQILREGVRAVLHGAAQGFIQGVSGGDPGKAFLTAALTSVAAGAFGFDGNGAAQGLGWADSVRGQDIGQILFGSAVGGVTSKLQNGNFFEGAAIGLTVSGLNHAMHKMGNESMYDEADQEDPPANKPSLEDLKKSPPNHPDYKAPKSGPRTTNHPRGKGWVDRDGRTWIPDDHGGTHAPHWDVQPKKGPGYETKYPMNLVTPKNVAIGVGAVGTGYLIYKVVVGLATWECFGCGILLTP